jgi:hypothetical protein
MNVKINVNSFDFIGFNKKREGLKFQPLSFFIKSNKIKRVHIDFHIHFFYF